MCLCYTVFVVRELSLKHIKLIFWSVIMKTTTMITKISALEEIVLRSLFVFVQKTKNINIPKELLVEKEVLTKKQLNAVVNNLKAKGIIEVNIDLFGFHMVSMSFDGKKFCQKLSKRKMKKEIVVA